MIGFAANTHKQGEHVAGRIEYDAVTVLLQAEK